MPHPSLGLPPADVTAGHPDAAARLRANIPRLARLGLQETVKDVDGFAERYDEEMLRLLLHDSEGHLEQLAKSLETGRDYYVTSYAEWLVPIYRRRHVPMRDLMALLGGLQVAVSTVLSPTEREAVTGFFERWGDALKHHQRLPGDHKGNKLIRFFWKGAGVGDDKWI